MTTPEQKAAELLSEFSQEKAIDICDTMIDLSKEYEDDVNVDFYEQVKQMVLSKDSNTNYKI